MSRYSAFQLFVNAFTGQVVVMQHIQLLGGRVMSAPYLSARGVG